MQPPPPVPPGPVVRRGTSKAVPIVVSAGLAIGVFCGLLFGLGIPEEEATASTTAKTTAPKDKTEGDVPEPFQPTTKDVKVPTDPKPGTGSGSQVAANAGSGAGSAKPEPPPAKPVKAIGKLTVVVKPEAVAKTAKIYVDDKLLDGNVFEIDLTDQLDKDKKEARKSVTVKIKAAGYKEYEQKVEIVAHPDQEEATSYEVELVKRPTSVRPPRPPPPGQPKCKKPPCGLIDI